MVPRFIVNFIIREGKSPEEHDRVENVTILLYIPLELSQERGPDARDNWVFWVK
jgi:hypothetical protein